MTVVTDVDPDRADRRLEDREAQVPRPKVELLPEALHLRDVVLAILAEVAAVGIDDEGGVVKHAGLLLLVDGDDEHQVQLAREPAHQLGRRSPRHCLGVGKVRRVLHLAEIRAVEELLEAEDLRSLGGCLARPFDAGVDHRLLLARPLALDERHTHHVRHRHPARSLLSDHGTPETPVSAVQTRKSRVVVVPSLAMRRMSRLRQRNARGAGHQGPACR